MWWFFVVMLVVISAEGQKRNYSNLPCPSSCVCFRRTIRCMRLDLTEIPKIPQHTTLLDLRFNKIREIAPGTFKGHKSIKSLLLNDNLLTKLETGVFVGLPSLKHLYLYKNRIKFIEPKVFQGLIKLEHLYLQNNEIEEFAADTFSNLPSLDRLFLFNNKIQHIPSGSFAGLNKLTRLRLDSNALVCDCQLAWFANMLQQNNIHSTANCKHPSNMYGKSLIAMTAEDFRCKAPEIMKGPQDIEISFGGTAVFSCHARGDPEPNIVWMHEEREVNLHDNRIEIMDDGSLMIKNTQDSDNGLYECMAKNVDGEAKSRPARMTVLNYSGNIRPDGYPQFQIKPQSLTTTDGAPEVRLSCKAVGHPVPEITWSRNGVSLSSSSRHFIDRDGTLIIRPVYGEDYGVYRCDASNVHGRISASAELQINVAPIFTIHPNSADINVGGNAKLECVAVGTPSPTITWFKENRVIQSTNRIHLSVDGTILEIRDAKESDSGLYICEARNSFGYREVSANLKVVESNNRRPKLVYKPYDMEAIEGSTIEIPCKAIGDPVPGIQWRKDGGVLQRTGRWKTSINGNLYIVSVTLEDQGRYECTAINEYGRDVASGFITVKEDPHPSGVGVGDKFVRVAFVEASHEVDKAINRTIEDLFHRNSSKGYVDLFRLIRYPKAPQRELARAAEVYERTLVNIRKHVEEGMSTNFTSDFNYKEILSPEHLDLVAQLSGCMVHKVKRNCTDMCFHAKYRTIDGMCNNFQHPYWGAANTGFRRILKPIYENGFSSPIGWNKDKKYFGYSKPSSRLVSTSLISTEKITPDDEITHMVMQWGQFLDHDLDHATPSVSSESWDGIDCKKSCEFAAPCFPIDIPPNDPRVKNRRCIDFVRSSAVCGSGMTSVLFETIQPREQINQLTSYIDASQVYGFSDELSRELRDLNNELGRLREGHVFPGRKPLLPYDANHGMDCRRDLFESNIGCFLAGDIRVNEQVGLISMHTLWFREHNRVAGELRRVNSHWDGETIFQDARKIVGAAMQHITYKHWLPFILGPKGMEDLGEYKSYNPNLNPTISNEFATAALRFGHTLINPILHRLNSTFQAIPQGHLPLHKAFFSPWRVVDEGGIDPLLRGLFTVPAKVKKPDQNLNRDLTEELFRTAHAVALDLAAMNIQRSRDHAIPGYLEYRRVCNLSIAETFDDLQHEISNPLIRQKLQELYGHPGNIDIFVGGILEDQVEGGRVGPLFRCLLVEQFRRLRDGDRFWYENPSTFKPEQLIQIKQFSLGRVICDNGDNITHITKDVFVLPNLQDGYVSCEEIPQADLSVWSECCDDCRSRVFNSLNRFKRSHMYEESSNKLYDNSTIYHSGSIGLEENKKLQERIVKLEETIDDMQITIKKMNKMIEKLENRKIN